MPLTDLLRITKPRQTLLLLTTMFCSYLIAGGRSLEALVIGGLAEFLAIAGTTAMNMYLEVDIDSLMPRTSRRPLPSGALQPTVALYFAALSFLAGVLLSHAISPLLTLTILIGFFSDILVYTNIAKRTTPMNILLGGVAGSMPALGGWVLASGWGAGGVILALIVMAWIPMHIWFLAIYFEDDYRSAGVPMLPVVAGPVKTSTIVEASLVVLALLTWALYLVEGVGLSAAIASTILTASSIRTIESFKKTLDKRVAKSLFKTGSPLLAAVFVLAALESLLTQGWV